ncbi:hypothetical protein PV761_21890 [Arthrobacter sp. CC3]|uniref:hypothetical protein n=1 Tax=Arthrobacter sp. CC3 TaxID=3029185 RepID=UPI0032636895
MPSPGGGATRFGGEVPVDQATIVSYAAGYLAAIILALLTLLPVLIPTALLLVVAGLVQLLLLRVRALALGLYRFTAELFHALARAIKARGDGPPGSHGARRLHIH